MSATSTWIVSVVIDLTAVTFRFAKSFTVLKSGFTIEVTINNDYLIAANEDFIYIFCNGYHDPLNKRSSTEQRSHPSQEAHLSPIIYHIFPAYQV